ncbi:ATP-dependent Clp protease, ATP-binding subunit ClpX [Bifidobacterium dolichotidis]|uniref:ATP-dependent Clp protease ATP-binding subunit ClpX n=1 Tax=Bifidobacterium dolichotidis TaxID=2306976 RepID=A0A430FSK0_9BIFI|nr:ATP-dependent Clp protease ATP-binding subunit ClpX [Bifidobacterium dolichotidis]RSX55807.1 ATP-dependent Clp protease, ATP-binding subunit ClpX [Bifidobacterium dolichotidis]
MGRVINYSDGMQHCSFCGKSEREVERLVAGAGVAICEECIALCSQIIADERTEYLKDQSVDLPTPMSIHEILNSNVIGQEQAKRTLAVAVYNHYKRVRLEELMELEHSNGVRGDAIGAGLEQVKVSKSNILLIGPTGVGKTYLAQTLAEAMDVPFIIADATSLTEAGYVGDDVETLLARLLDAANGDVERARHGIIYIDEIDKIARKSGENTSLARDVSGEGVQQALLKLMEGTVANVPVEGTRKHRDAQTVQMDTKDVLFICAGAFVGLDEIVERRLGRHESGFGSSLRLQPLDYETLSENANADDLAEFGLLPEFIGRMPVVSVLQDLSIADLKAILTEPRDALTKQYAKLFAADGVELQFTDDALDQIAQLAKANSTGARGLRSIMEHALESTMYELPSLDDVIAVVVDGAAIRGEREPQYILANAHQQKHATLGDRLANARRAMLHIAQSHPDDSDFRTGNIRQVM